MPIIMYVLTYYTQCIDSLISPLPLDPLIYWHNGILILFCLLFVYESALKSGHQALTTGSVS